MDPKITLFERSSIYQSRICYPKKSFFDRSRVARRRYVFAKLTDPEFQLIADALTVPPKKCVRGAAAQWQNAGKSVRRRRRRRMENRRTFLSVAHTKCPSGN